MDKKFLCAVLLGSLFSASEGYSADSAAQLITCNARCEENYTLSVGEIGFKPFASKHALMLAQQRLQKCKDNCMEKIGNN